ncbi:MAG: DMT family transporter [Verrucomicrobiota bacterium]|nr:DMT family transporter [Verrucomicrobiota bacterium]
MTRSIASANDAPTTSQPRLSKGYAAIFATVVIWSTPSLFLFYLNRYYDPYAQNFYRYSVACLAVLPFLFIGIGSTKHPLDRRAFLACVIPAIPNVIHQISQVLALFYIGPGVFAIFMRTSVIITAVLALIFFPEERWVLRQWRFQVGTVFGLLGAVGVFWFQPGTETSHVPLAGVLTALSATFCWAAYSVLVKRPSAQLGSIRSFGLISLVTSALLLPLTLLFGDITTPLHTTAHVNLIVILSALLCISLAHILYYIAIRELGVALSQTLQLVCPAASLGLSAWIFGERLTTAQLVSAAVLLVGAFLAMQVKPQQTSAAAETI